MFCLRKWLRAMPEARQDADLGLPRSWKVFHPNFRFTPINMAWKDTVYILHPSFWEIQLMINFKFVRLLDVVRAICAFPFPFPLWISYK